MVAKPTPVPPYCVCPSIWRVRATPAASALQGSDRRLFGAVPSTSPVAIEGYSLMVYCLLMLTCTQPSSLASLSARQSRATTYSGSSSCGAPIILRRQIIPCSAYSAEQSGHDCSQRGKPRFCHVWSARKRAPARRLAVQPCPASSASALSE
jgi:hypothetical protein